MRKRIKIRTPNNKIETKVGGEHTKKSMKNKKFVL
jgi:hypothetical protein